MVIVRAVCFAVSSSSVAPWTRRTSSRCHVGHCDGEFSHNGPWFHWVELCRWSYLMPLERRSAGLSADGQYLYEVEMECISATLLLTKGFNLFSLNIHERTIQLWDHRTSSVLMVSDVLTNRKSLAAKVAVISSSLGREL